jgi:Tol biopolymer transport system component
MPRYSRVAYGAGQLLFVHDRILQAQPFAPDRTSLRGEPQILASDVKFHPGSDAAFDVSSTGVLVYGLQPSQMSTRLTLVDRRGQEVRTVADAGSYYQPRFSPDGQRVVAEKVKTPSTRDLWIYGIARQSAVRFTNANAPDMGPVWSPDGKRIAFSSKRGSVFDIFIKTVDSTAPEQMLFTGPGDKLLEHWSPDGRYLVGTVRRSGLWILPLAPREKPWRVRAGYAETWQSEFSPDGRWLSYISDESGQPEVYVEPFPATGARWQISPSGGAQPHWRRDGKELFFLGADGMLRVLRVSAQNWPEVQPSELFRVSVPDMTRTGGYAVSPDGTTFVVNLVVSGPIVPAIDVVVNWTSLLAK